MAVNKAQLKSPSGMLKLLALLLTVVCLILFRATPLGLAEHKEHLAIIACGAYTIILAAFIVTYLLGEGAHLKLEAILMIVGAVLFIATGIIAIINYDRAPYSVDHRDHGLAFGSLALIDGVVMLLDFLLVGKAIKGK